MRRLAVYLLVALSSVSLVVAGCSAGAPAPAQAPATAPGAKAPAAPAQAAAPAAPPAAAPAKQSGFPEKGRAIQVIVPFGAGGGTDISARNLAAPLEKELGVPVEIINKPGAGSQLGLTEFSKAKPDGYTLSVFNIPSALTMYLNPERKASFERTSFLPVASMLVDPGAVAVKADGPFKNMKDLVDAAKANPGKIKAATTGLLSDDHLAVLQVQKTAGVKFAIVHFDGGSERETAMMGAKVDAAFGNNNSFYSLAKQGGLRVIGIMDKQEWKLAPGVPTMAAQGYDVNILLARLVSVPAGTPKDVVEVLSNAVRKATADSGYQQKTLNSGMVPGYMDSAQASALWTQTEAMVVPLMKEALAEK